MARNDKDGKYEGAIKALVTDLRANSGGKIDLKQAIQDASETSGWKYLEGIRLGVRALEAADAIEFSWDGKRIGLKANGPVGVGAGLPAAEEKRLRDQLKAEIDLKAEALKSRAEAIQLASTLKAERDAAIAKQKAPSPIHEVRITDDSGKVVRSVKASFHAMFPRVLALAKARKNIFIYGPTGCGKTHLASQLAKVLGLPFAFVSCSAGMSEGKLEGRLLPVGKQGTFEYVTSEFIKCYEDGGVFLLDEIDAADPNVLLLINAALANGKVAVPNRPEKPYAARHKDFVCIAAANTVGTGADRLYAGRNKLDAATLDRFQIGKIMMDYDPSVEAELCPDATLRSRLQTYRQRVREHRLERAISTRFLKDAYEMMQAGWTLQDVDDALFTGWREDEVTKTKGR